MSFESAFKLSSLLLLAAGFAALLMAGAVAPVLALLFLGALAVRLRWGGFRLTAARQAAAFAFLLAGFGVDAALFSGLVQASVHLLILISLIKINTAETNRDYMLLYSISFTFLLIGSTYTISILFLISLIVYFFFCILTFILFESKAAYEENRTAEFSLRSYAQAAAMITALIIALAVPIFVVIPRTALGLFKTGDEGGANLSGFSDRVSLGDIGRIIANRTVFMRVELDRPDEQIPANLKWRGIALDHFDGKAWSNTAKDYQQLPQDVFGTPAGEESAKRFLIPINRRGDETLLRQTISIEPISRVIFGADRIIQVAGRRVPGSSVLIDRNDSLSFVRTPPGPVRYTVHSDVSDRVRKLAGAAAGEAAPSDIRDRYLQLPRLDPRVAQLAARLTSPYPDPVSKALVLEKYLSTAYSYSLANRSASVEDPLADFLFRTRQGHCEYFATALAVMLRTTGVATRVVNGFRIGERNPWGDYYIVRQSDAHSWVEVYLPGAGWVDFDATPARSASPSDFYLARATVQFLDAIDVFWTEVVTFDRLKQVRFFISMGSKMREGVDRFSFSMYRIDHLGRYWLRRLNQWEGPDYARLTLLLLAAGGAVLAWRKRRRIRLFWRRRVLGRSPSELAPDYYLELLEVLGRKGLTRRPSETPLEFARRAGPGLGTPLPMGITRHYYRSRYGNHPLDDSELADIQASLRQLKNLKPPAPRPGA